MGLCSHASPCREEQIPAEVPCRRSVLIALLSPSSSSPHLPARDASVAHPTVLVLVGELLCTSSSWVRLIPSAPASSLACYPRSPGLALDTLESCPGSAPVSPWDCHRLQLACARENTSSCLCSLFLVGDSHGVSKCCPLGVYGAVLCHCPPCLARSSPSMGSLHPFTPGEVLSRSRVQARHVDHQAHKTAKFP